MRKPSEEAIKAGNDMAGYLMDASIKNSFGEDSLGGCKPLNMNDYPKEYQRLITQYLAEKIDSVTAIYMAMQEVEGENLCGHTFDYIRTGKCSICGKNDGRGD